MTANIPNILKTSAASDIGLTDKCRGDTIGKVLVITFADDEEEVADKVMSVLMNQKNFEYMERTVEEELHFRDLSIYPDTREVYHRGKEAGLTFTQFELLHILARKPGRVFTKEILYEMFWDGFPSDISDIIMSHIQRIREQETVINFDNSSQAASIFTPPARR